MIRPAKPELKRLHDFIVQEAAHVSRKITRAEVRAVIATSGTAAALAGAAQSLRLTRSGGVSQAVAEKLAKRLAKMTDRQRAAIKGNQSQAGANHRGRRSGLRTCA